MKARKRRASFPKKQKPSKLQEKVQRTLEQALAFHQSENLDEAEQLYLQVLSLNPDNFDALHLLGVVKNEKGHTQEAYDLISRAISTSPHNANAHSNMGMVYHNLGDYPAAIESYGKARALAPLNPLTMLNMGNAFFELNSHEEALVAYQEALRLKPDLFFARKKLASSHLRLGEADKAAAILLQLIQANPQFSAAYHGIQTSISDPQIFQEILTNLGNAFDFSGKYVEAQQCFQRLSEMQPDAPSPILRISAIDWKTGARGDARNYLREAFKRMSSQDDRDASEKTNPEPLPRVVALLCLGRSGTMFFQSLFDGHPDISTIPGVYFKGFFGEDIWDELNPEPKAPSWKEDLTNNFCNAYPVLFNSASKSPVFGNPFGPGMDIGASCGLTRLGPDQNSFLVLDEDHFRQVLLELLQPYESMNARRFFVLIHQAHERVRNRQTPIRTIFYHLHNPNEYELTRFLSLFPDCQLIQLVREPVQTFESSLKNLWPDESPGTKERDKTQRILKAYQAIGSALINLLEVMAKPEFEGAEMLGVRLEDLKSAPKTIIPMLANWLGIASDNTLYESTFYGAQFWGPYSKMNPNLKGFDDSNIKKTVGSILTERDAQRLQTLFGTMRAHYGYSKASERVAAPLEMNIDEPFDFERKLHSLLPETEPEIQELASFKLFRVFLKTYWDLLDHPEATAGFPPPVQLP